MIGGIELSDAEIKAAAEGSEPQRSKVLEAFKAQVRLMVTARLSVAPDKFHAIDEITQQTMVGLSAGLSRLEHRTVVGLKAYASGVAARKVADHIKRLKSDRPGARMASLDSSIASVSHAGPMWQFLSETMTSPQTQLEREDQLAQLVRELGNLKQEYRDVITMAFFDQLPTAEIARILNISRPAASMLVLRAIKTLRRNMTGTSQVGVHVTDTGRSIPTSRR